VTTGLGCALDVRREGPRLRLAFVLRNPGAQPRTIHYYRPFLQFDLRVTGDGKSLTVSRGDFDGPVQPAELQVPASGTATLETPVVLQFAAAAAPSDGPFTWTVIDAPGTIELRATLRIEHEVFPECVARIERPR
jgi:hypothetical protein